MKLKTNRLIIVILVAAGSAMLGLAGCAGLGSSNTESLLSAAGFRAATPQTPQQKQTYATLPAYKVHRATVNGKTFHVSNDAKNGVVYVGHDPEYQNHQQLAIQQNIAQQNTTTAARAQAVAMPSYGPVG